MIIPVINKITLDWPKMNHTIDKNGDERWYNDKGQLHRIGGPAIKCRHGYEEWRQNGLLHRLHGQAIVWTNGDEEWWIDGILYTEEEFNKIVKDRK